MNKPKKITFLIASLAGGGAQRVCVTLANSLAENGWQVDLVILNLNNSVYQKQLDLKVNIHVLGVKKISHSFLKIRTFLLSQKDNHFPVIAFNYQLAAIALLAFRTTNLKRKLIIRNINNYSNIKNHHSSLFHEILFKINAVSIKRSDHIINQCSSMERDLLQEFPSMKGKTSYIYNPVSNNTYKYKNKIPHIKKKYFLCIGRIEKQKSFNYAIQAFAQFSKNHNDYKLKIIGVGSLEKDLKKLVSSLKITHLVEFEGFQENTSIYYLEATATLLTSLYEGFPNVLIESITLGTPVISFDCPSGPSEIIQNGVNGYLIPHLDIEHFSNAMQEAVRYPLDPFLVQRTSHRFSEKNITTQYEDLIKKLQNVKS